MIAIHVSNVNNSLRKMLAEITQREWQGWGLCIASCYQHRINVHAHSWYVRATEGSEPQPKRLFRNAASGSARDGVASLVSSRPSGRCRAACPQHQGRQPLCRNLDPRPAPRGFRLASSGPDTREMPRASSKQRYRSPLVARRRACSDGGSSWTSPKMVTRALERPSQPGICTTRLHRASSRRL